MNPSEIVTHDLAYSLHWCFYTAREKAPEASAATFADAWVSLAFRALHGITIGRLAGSSHLSRPLPFAGTHRIETEAFYAARSGSLGGGNIDVLFQLWIDSEDRWATYGTPILFHDADRRSSLSDPDWRELKERCARVSLATPCGRVLFLLGKDHFRLYESGNDYESPDWFRVSDMVGVGGSRISPAPRNGRGLMDFCVDLASGWVGDPALSGANENPIMGELLSNFHIGHVLRVKIVRDDYPKEWKPAPRLE